MIRILCRQDAWPILARKSYSLAAAEQVVRPILDAVEARGDAAVFEYAARFDGFHRNSLLVESSELYGAVVEPELERALGTAKANIKTFAQLQMPKEFQLEMAPGHWVGQVVRPLERIAAYVPGGRYPLPSTVLMTCVPASVAGVSDIWVTTPKENPAIFAAARVAEVSHVALIGGAQAIAAFAFGTDTIPRADRIVGPGNVYVSAAKKLLAGQVGIDFVAGPTEVLIAASSGNPSWIAADMLAQAEHDIEASAFFLTTSSRLADEVAREIEKQLMSLPTGETARVAIDGNSAIVLCESEAEMVDIINLVKPEHLCIESADLIPQVGAAGSVFVGPYSPEAAGDYVTGPNHVLPTAGAAQLTGGLSVLDFLKVITVQELSHAGLQAIGRDAAILARAEGLEGHARSIEVRLNG